MERLIYIGLGTLAMLILSLLKKNRFHIPAWKAIVLPVLLTISGVLGAMLLAYVESGGIWGGISFYGSVLLIPILMPGVSLLLRIPYLKIMDMAAPQVCAMLAVMKVHCHVSGCCGGKTFYSDFFKRSFVFPSQIVEVFVAIMIMSGLLLLFYKNKSRGSLYGIFFLVYGSVRFCLNFFRAGIKPFVWIIPAGHLWSIVSILIGVIWVFIVRKRKDVMYDQSI